MIRNILLSCIPFVLISCSGGSGTESTPGPGTDEQKAQIKEEWKGYWKYPSNFIDLYINITDSGYKAYTFSEAYSCFTETGDHEITEITDTGFTYYSLDKEQNISINLEVTEEEQLKITWLNADGTESSTSSLYNETDLLSPTLCSEDTEAGFIHGTVEFQNLQAQLPMGNESLNVELTFYFDVNNDGIMNDSDIEISLKNVDVDEADFEFDLSNMQISERLYDSYFQFNRYNSFAVYSISNESNSISFTIDRSTHVAYKYITNDTQILVHATYSTSDENGANISSSDYYPEADTYTSGLDNTNLIDLINDYQGTHNYFDITRISIEIEESLFSA